MSAKLKSITAKLCCLITLNAVLAPNTYAEGFDVGLQVGMSNTHRGREPVPSDGSAPGIVVKPSSTSIAGRIYMGYDFTYGGWEFGIARYGNANYSSANGSGSIRTNGIDLDGKIIFPFFTETGFSLFGKLGISFLRAERSRGITPVGQKSVNSGIYPLLAAGLAYHVTPRSVFDLSWTKIFGRSSNLPQVDFIALGYSYHWDPVYCGQFLC